MIKIYRNIVVCFTWLCLPVTIGFSSLVNANESFDALIEEIWEYESNLREVKPADISPQALNKQHQRYSSFLEKTQQYQPAELSQEQKITLLMQQYRLNNYIDQHKFESFKVPLTSEYGFHSALATLPKATRFSTLKDYRDYLTQLKRIKGYIQQNIAYMQQGLEQGYTQPKAVLKDYEASVTPFLVDKAQDSVFYTPFKTLPSFISKEQAQKLRNQAKAVISSDIVSAYKQYHDFLVDHYIPQARESIAASDWPNGEAYYNNRIKHYTTTDMNAQQVHDLGLNEVKRIRNAMQKIVDELNFDGDIDAFIHFLRTDPQFYAKTPEALLKQASFIAKRADASLPALFEKLPRTPYGVAPVPEDIAPKYTTGRYIHAANETEPGYYWVNTYALDKRPLYALPALTLHEAVPGHHLQISLAKEMSDLPAVRQNTYISAFGEGWGLYSEFLGIEAGIYQTPYDHFGRLSYEMWRACRLVVDTGMHMFGWTRQQAIDYMMKNTALSEHNIKTEIDRYISWPAQALSYKIGEIKIKALRQKAEQALGEQFDVREFHTAVLAHGSVPLFVLEQNINAFIKNKQTGK